MVREFKRPGRIQTRNFFKRNRALSKNQTAKGGDPQRPVDKNYDPQRPGDKNCDPQRPGDKDGGPQRPDLSCTVIKEETTVSTLEGYGQNQKRPRKKIKKEKPLWFVPRRSLRVENLRAELGLLADAKVTPKREVKVEVEEAIRVLVPIFTCRLCKDGVKMNVLEFKAHYQVQHEGVKLPRTARHLHLYTCDVCGKFFKCWKNLQSHMEAHNNLYDCEFCGVNYKRVLDYVLHVRSHEGEEGLFRCIYCDYATPSVNDITVHVSMKHEVINPPKYVCEICQKGFHMYTWFKEHGNYHTGEKPFKCELCDKSFLYTRHLTAHRIYVHLGGQGASSHQVFFGYQCVICGKKYQHRNSLKLHMNVHTGKVVICEVCGRQLSSMEKLKFHMRVHTGYKPYKCGYCEKAFTKKPILVEHERIHTGVKPYVCGHCGRPFSQRSSLVIHIRGHTGERPFACHICGKAFVARAMLNLHFKTCKGVY